MKYKKGRINNDGLTTAVLIVILIVGLLAAANYLGISLLWIWCG